MNLLGLDLNATHAQAVHGPLLAAALAGYAEQAWSEAVVVIDIVDQALSIGLVRAAGGQARLLETRHFPNLGLKTWKDRLINALADTCVLQSRRDPRDVPQAEQSIFEQLDALLEAGLQGRMIHLGIQAPQWYENILVHPDQASAFCALLTRQVVREVHCFFQLLSADEPRPALLMTAAARRLPGVARQLHSRMGVVVQEPRRPPAKFILGSQNGSHLLFDGGRNAPCGAKTTTLSPAAPAKSANAAAAPASSRPNDPDIEGASLVPEPLPQDLSEWGKPRVKDSELVLERWQDRLMAGRPCQEVKVTRWKLLLAGCLLSFFLVALFAVAMLCYSPGTLQKWLDEVQDLLNF